MLHGYVKLYLGHKLSGLTGVTNLEKSLKVRHDEIFVGC